MYRVIASKTRRQEKVKVKVMYAHQRQIVVGLIVNKSLALKKEVTSLLSFQVGQSEAGC